MAELLAPDRWRSTRWAVLIFMVLSPLVLVPLTGMNWGLEDLIASTGLIVGAGLAYELVLHVWHNPRARVVGGVAALASALLIWAELAVGLVD